MPVHHAPGAAAVRRAEPGTTAGGGRREPRRDVLLVEDDVRLARALSLALERVRDCQDIVDSRLLDVHVRRLRTELGQDPSAPSLVVTLRGLGSRLVA